MKHSAGLLAPEASIGVGLAECAAVATPGLGVLRVVGYSVLRQSHLLEDHGALRIRWRPETAMVRYIVASMSFFRAVFIVRFHVAV